jgi:hypothetical protein
MLMENAMTNQLLRLALALMLAGGVGLAGTDTADAKSRRSAYKKPKARVLVVRPYVPPGVLNERECVRQYDNRGVALPYHITCDAAWRRLYSR